MEPYLDLEMLQATTGDDVAGFQRKWGNKDPPPSTSTYLVLFECGPL